MTKEEAVIILDGFKNNPLFSDTHAQAFDMAISALSADGEYIKKSELLQHVVVEELSDFKDCDVIHAEVIDELTTYSFPDSAEIENTTVYVLKAILRHGHCYCDSEGLPAYKAIKNAIAIITSLEKLKAEIKCNTEHCECVPDGSCIRVDKVLEIIDKHIGGKDK